MGIDTPGRIDSVMPRFTPNVDDDKRLKDACRDFEGILIFQMLKSMRKTLSNDDIFGKGMGKDIYQSMYDQALSEMVARGENNLGIGDALYQELVKHQKPQSLPEPSPLFPTSLSNDKPND